MSGSFAAKTGWLQSMMRLIRWPNLVILGGIQTLVYLHGVRPQEPVWYLLLVVAMTLTTTAAGYIHNDLVDEETDLLNNKHNVFASGLLTHRTGWYVLGVLTGAGFLASLFLSLQWSWMFMLIFICIGIVLGFYSTVLKGMALAGNLAVSLLCSVAVFIVCYPVMPWDEIQENIFFLATFAFAVTWIRELVKDIEDLPGDTIAGYHTLPVVAGVRVTKSIAAILIFLVLAGLIVMYLSLQNLTAINKLCYVLTALLLIYAGLSLMRARLAGQYHRVSILVKAAMISGTLACL